MSNAQVGSCKGRWKGTSRCSAGIVEKGTCRLGKRGGRDQRWEMPGERERRIWDEWCKGLESISGLGRFGETTAGWRYRSAPSPPFPLWICALAQMSWERKVKTGRLAVLRACPSLPTLEISPHPALQPYPNHRAVAHPAAKGKTSTLRVAWVAQTAGPHPFQETE